MNKTMKSILCALLAMVMVFAMVGCEKVEQVVDQAADKVAGKITEKIDSAAENTDDTAAPAIDSVLGSEETNAELNGYATERPLPDSSVVTLEPVTESTFSGNDPQLEAVAAKYEDEFLQSLKAGFEMGANGMTCQCFMEVQGTALVVTCLVGGMDDVPQEGKDAMQQYYDSIKDVMRPDFNVFKEEAPNLTLAMIYVCEADGDVLATIELPY